MLNNVLHKVLEIVKKILSFLLYIYKFKEVIKDTAKGKAANLKKVDIESF